MPNPYENEKMQPCDNADIENIKLEGEDLRLSYSIGELVVKTLNNNGYSFELKPGMDQIRIMGVDSFGLYVCFQGTFRR
jgi:hypothetical protein